MKAYKSILLVFILVVLFTPLLQFRLNLVEVRPLDGDVTLAPDTSISVTGWFNSGYQDAKEKFVNDNFGFRSFYVRLRNELHYLLFSKVYAKEVVAGKSGFLYELKYLQTHAGLDYIGDEKVAALFTRLKFIQDTLQKKGITFAVLLAPGKATFYPEYIPAPYDQVTDATNYLRFAGSARSQKINHIDYNSWFASMKQRTSYPLYPKTGTHWSIYGMHVALDSLAGFMEAASGKKLLRFDYSKVELSDSLRHPDGDIAAGLNLLRELPHFTMAYPEVTWKDSTGVWKPRVLTVADSYWMGVYFTELPAAIFRDHEFWYYNKILYNYDAAGKTYNVTDYDLKSSVEKNDFVFIMATEASLKHIGWGIIDELYHLYKDGPTAYRLAQKYRRKRAEIGQIEFIVWNDEKWFGQIRRQAKKLGIPVDSCVRMNAIYYYNEVHKNDPPVNETFAEQFEERVLRTRVLMEQTKEWNTYLVNKAKQLHISLDSCMNMDARWTVEQQMLKERVEWYKEQIRKTPSWLKDVEAKAANWKISVDSCIALDARYMADQDLKKK